VPEQELAVLEADASSTQAVAIRVLVAVDSVLHVSPRHDED
jgi:hypothetical protein